ncbi:hypothetical protein [Paludibaculum fermentans]|uniref:hypothetical protein n=1 Tax=Paludibaculum fermentans TaxID=1473598 RepID=UPI003EB89A43
MLLPSTGSANGMAPVMVGAGLIYAGVWIVLQPAGAWRLMQGLVEGIQRFESSLRGSPWWQANPDTLPDHPPAGAAFRIAGAVVATLGVVSLAGGLSQWA